MLGREHPGSARREQVFYKQRLDALTLLLGLRHERAENLARRTGYVATTFEGN